MTLRATSENGTTDTPRLDRGVVGITAAISAAVVIVGAVVTLALGWGSVRSEIGETRAALRELVDEVKNLRGAFSRAETERARIEERVEALRVLERRKEKP